MSMVSYAQNYEDVMLLRALGDVERGFYVDVGAQDPVVDSVTKAFYERGWRGINIEPVRHWHDRLAQDRPEDINLRLLVTDLPGEATLHEVVDTGLSTMDASLAAMHSRVGRKVVEQVVECATLDSVLSRHAPDVIHFLKLDVEGSEARALAGLSLSQYRPWVLVIEACAPNSRIETHGEWEPGVLAAGYRFVYFDGLNRFYLAEEHASRAVAFSSPPNALDDFIRQAEWRQIEVLKATIAEREEQLGQWRARAASESAHAGQLQRLSDARHAEVESLRALVGDWSARASELSELVERLQQLADGRQAQLINAEAELGNARTELADERERLGNARTELAGARSQLVAAKAELMSARAAHSFVEMELQQRNVELAQVLGSRSWRLTRPLRVFVRLLRHGPAELVGAVFASTGSGRMGAAANAVTRMFSGGEKRMTAAEGDRPGQEPAAVDVLSDRGEKALAAMDRARGWAATDRQGKH